MTLESILIQEDTADAVVAITNNKDSEEERKQQVTVDFKMVTFCLSGKDYAIDIMHVKEIAKAGQFTYVPNVLPFVVGVYNLRGEIIPILDMRLFFNIEIKEKSKNGLENLLILSVQEQTFGIIVDKIDKVVGVQKSSVQPPHPLFSDVNVKYISGVVESNKHLYILLDIERIFSKTSQDASEHAPPKKNVVAEGTVRQARIEASVEEVTSPAPQPEVVKEESEPAPVKEVQKTESPSVKPPVVEAAKAPVKEEVLEEPKEEVIPETPKEEVLEDPSEYKFIVESLKNFKKFNVSDVNEKWIKHRYNELKEEQDKVQLQSEADASEFLKPFWSTGTDGWWSKEYADAVYNILPENSAKQVVVWNPGCGKGTETYCLACVLTKKYPDSKIRVYAQDIDLLNVSNAPMMTVPENVAGSWLAPYLTKNASGKDTFNKEIKDSIMFEYHDCLHTNALPMTDVIFARDLLSFIDIDQQKNVVTDFDEKLKGNGFLMIGENEEIDSSEFMESTVGSLTAYKKQ